MTIDANIINNRQCHCCITPRQNSAVSLWIIFAFQLRNLLEKHSLSNLKCNRSGYRSEKLQGSKECAFRAHAFQESLLDFSEFRIQAREKKEEHEKDGTQQCRAELATKYPAVQPAARPPVLLADLRRP